MVRTTERVSETQPRPLSVIPSRELASHGPDAALLASGVTGTSAIDLEAVRAVARERGARHRAQSPMHRS